jgi:hypothetical protein
MLQFFRELAFHFKKFHHKQNHHLKKVDDNDQVQGAKVEN